MVPAPTRYAQAHFCPIDQNLLHVSNNPCNAGENPGDNQVGVPEHLRPEDSYYMRGDGEQQRVYRWYCLTCAYTHPIEGVVRVDVDLTPKDVDDVLGGEGAWKYAAVEKAVSCERDGCESTSAYFREVQTRSADEAATLYFRCTECKYQWVHRG